MVPALWLLLAALLLLARASRVAALDLPDADDLARLVQVRDLLAGQGWFDQTQYRLAPPQGVAMHWSRLIDAPIALAMLALQPLLGAAAAERTVVALWPLLLLLGTLWAAAAVVRRLLGPAALFGGGLLAITALVRFESFWPGRIDHHGAQILLAVSLLALLLRAQAAGSGQGARAGWSGWAAGILAALSILIGAEGLPFAAAAAAFLVLRWIRGGNGAAPLLRAYALGTAGALSLGALATLPPSALFVPACDAVSLVHLAAAWGGALLAVLLPALGARLASPWARSGLAGSGCACLAAALPLAFPACLEGPFAALPAELDAVWLKNVLEAQSLGAAWRQSPAFAVAAAAFPFAALLPTFAALRCEARQRWAWGLVALFLLAGLAMTVWMIRGAVFANIMAVPGAAWLLHRLLHDARLRAVRWRWLACVALFALFGNGLGPSYAAMAVERLAPASVGLPSSEAFCRRPDSLAPLRGLAPGHVLAPVDLGAAILAHSPHSVAGAPYHRNVAGNLFVLRAFTAPPAQGRALLLRQGIDWVAACPGMREARLYRAENPDGLLPALLRGQAPGWLAPVPGLVGPLRVWRVVRP